MDESGVGLLGATVELLPFVLPNFFEIDCSFGVRSDDIAESSSFLTGGSVDPLRFVKFYFSAFPSLVFRPGNVSI